MSKKILIIDDDEIICRLISQILSKNGYSVSTANNVSDGILKVQENIPDLILLDYMLPDNNGLEFLKILRQHPRYTYLPVIMITSKGEKDVVISAVQCGVNNFLVKPINPEVLLERIDQGTKVISLETVRGMLKNLRVIDEAIAKRLGKEASTFQNLDVYLINYNERRYCILLENTYKPVSAAIMDAEELAKKVSVFAYNKISWQKTWPDYTLGLTLNVEKKQAHTQIAQTLNSKLK